MAGWRRWLALALGLVLAVLGQLSFAGSPPHVIDGLVLYAVAILLFTASLHGVGGRQQARSSHLLRSLTQMAALGLGVVLSFRLLTLLARDEPLEHLPGAAFLWLGSIAATLVGVGATSRRQSESHDAFPEPLRTRWLVGLLLLAAVLRLWHLGSIPWTISGDEGSFGLQAAAVAAGSLRNPWITGWAGQPTMSFFVTSPFLRWFGQDSLALRLPWAILGTLTVILAYRLAARLQGRLVGLLTALFLAAWGFHIHYSRLGLGFAADGFLATLGVLLLLRAVATGSRLTWAGAGTVGGLALYAYAGARVLPALLATLAILGLVAPGAVADRTGTDRQKRWELRRGAGAMALVALVVAAPMLQFSLLHTDDFNARINTVGVFQSGWLDREVELRGASELEILADQFARALLAFNLYPDRNSHYGSPDPLLGFVAGVFFLLGLGYCSLRAMGAERRGTLPMVIWWWAGLAGSVLTVSTPETQRMTILAVPSAFFLAVAVERVSRAMGRMGSWSDARTAAVALSTVGLLGLGSAVKYFASYTPSLVYGNPNAVVATALGRYAQQRLAPGGRVVFFGAPRMYVDFGSLPFLAPHVRRVDVVDPLTSPPSLELGCGEEGTAFVFLPERAAELELVRATFPAADTEWVTSPRDDSPLFLVHRVDQPCPGSAE